MNKANKEHYQKEQFLLHCVMTNLCQVLQHVLLHVKVPTHKYNNDQSSMYSYNIR